MKFRQLMTLHLIHDYYTDRRCLDFWIAPTLATQRLLRNYRCLLKSVPNGVQILTAMIDDDAPLISLRTGLTFTFHLRLRNPDFALFTDLTEITHATSPIYTDADMSPGNPMQLAPRSREVASTERSAAQQPQTERDVFIDVEMSYHASLSAMAQDPQEFQVTFKAKRARWRYYIVTDRTDGSFHIEDKDASPLIFSDKNRTDLNEQPDASDTIAMALAQQYPQMRRLCFVSDDLIACQEQARKSIQLRLDSNQALGVLPNPSLRNYAAKQIVRAGKPQTEEALFHVVKYFTQQFQTTGGW